MLRGRTAQTATKPRRPAAFTLVEMLVVVSIVVLLTGLTLTAVNGAVLRSEIRRTELTLSLLDTAVQEWELQADRRLTWGDDNMPHGASYDIQFDTPFHLIISEILESISRPPSVQAILARFDPDLLYTYEAGVYPPWLTRTSDRQTMDERFADELTVLDAWGWPIYALHAGAVGVPGPNGVIDPDGTEQTVNELYFGVARNRRICFVSAGPDRQWGNMSADPGSAKFAATRDNLFSYPVDRPAAH